MKLTLHHINLATENVARMDNFYQEIMGLSPDVAGLPVLEKSRDMQAMLLLYRMAICRCIWRKKMCWQGLIPGKWSIRLRAAILRIVRMT